VGLDVAGVDLVVARMGVRSAFSNRMGHLGRWVTVGFETAWWAASGVLDTLVALDLDQHDRVSAVLAVPGWFGFADRAAVRCSLETDRHRIAVVVASSTAAAAHAAASGLLATGEGRVLAVDVASGLTASLVSIGADGIVEHGVAGLAPSTIDQDDRLQAAVGAMIAGLIERCSGTGQPTAASVDALLVFADEPQSPQARAVVAGLAAPGAALWPPIDPVVVERGGSVAEGAVRLADPAAPAITSAAPCGLGVLVQDADEVRVLAVLEAGAALPVVVSSLFAGTESVEGDAAEVVVEWVEIHLDPSRPPSRALVARGVGELLPTITSPQGVLEVDLLVGADGELNPLPVACWVAQSGTPLVRTVPTAQPADLPFDAVQPIAVPPDAVLPDAVLPDAEADVESGLPDSVLEELARAEVSAVSLGEALVCCERLVSREVGTDVAIRSVYELFGCDDGSGVGVLRAAARRLDEVMARRPSGDALAGAVEEAIRAARRTFTDPTEPRYFGGSLAAIEAELVHVVEHLLLVVGEVSPAERRRVAADARASGLPHDRIETMLTAMLGASEPGDDRDAGGGVQPGLEAVVSVDPADGRCTLTGAVPDGVVPIRVVVAASMLVT
jgi:hypothetical protein